MKVWVTKYALTKGIIYMEVTPSVNNPDLVRETGNQWANPYHVDGNEWHSKKDTAIRKAEQMRQNKLQSLKKQIDKLTKLSFK